MPLGRFLQPPEQQYHQQHRQTSINENDDINESSSLLQSASSSLHQDEYYETSSTSDMDAESTISYATFHTVKEPEQHLIERGLLFDHNNDEDDAIVLPLEEHSNSSENKHINKIMLVFCLCISVGSLGLDTGIVLLLLNTISTEFQCSNLGVWIHLAYLFGCLFSQPLCRNLVNTIGRKTLLVIAQCLFLIGSLSCSATQDMMQIVLSRMIAGLGGGMLLPLSSIVISDLTLYDQQSSTFVMIYYERYHLFVRTAPALGLVLGPYAAGIINEWIGWRYCFYINLIPCLITLCLYMFWLPNYNHHQGHYITKNKKKKTTFNGNSSTTHNNEDYSTISGGDYLGTLLLVTATVSLVTGIALGGNLLDWNHPVIILLFSIGGSIGVFYFIYENKYASNPMIPNPISLQDISTILIQFTTWSSFIMMMYLIPQFFMGVKQQKTSLAGLWSIPYLASFMITTLITGWYHYFTLYSCVTRGKTSRWVINKWILVIISLFHMGITLITSKWWNQDTFPIILILTEIGYGYITGTLISTILVYYDFFSFIHMNNYNHNEITVLQQQQQDQDIPSIISTMYIIRTLGELFGITFASAILQTNLKTILDQEISEPNVIEHIRTSISDIHTLSPLLQSIVQKALLLSIQNSFFYYGTTCAIIGFIATLFIQTKKLS
ncbi:major facilitator superfamily domain-containing protein [Circinella umbellata]|nr:major facilitator superfamily domain-containing protein [Circinella umbellata]